MSSKLRYENGRFVSDATTEEREAFKENARSFRTTPSATPTRSSVEDFKEGEKQAVKDLDAYKRLRKDGLQPPSLKGASDLESRAKSDFEVSTGHVLKDEKNRKEIDSLLAESKG